MRIKTLRPDYSATSRKSKFFVFLELCLESKVNSEARFGENVDELLGALCMSHTEIESGYYLR